MNIKQLTYVAAVVQNGSLSAAAKNLYVTVQAVSKAISDLERELGHDLFVRENRGMQPTPFGREFYGRASDVVSCFDDLAEFARSYDDRCGQPRALRLALNTPPFTGNEVVRHNSAALIESQLGIDVTIDLLAGEAGMEALLKGEYDALVTIGSVRHPGTECHVIGTVPLGIMMSKDHPLASHEMVSLADLVPYPIALSSLWLAASNETASAIFRERAYDLKFVEVDFSNIHQHFREGGLSIAVGISAFGKANPLTTLRLLVPEDAVTTTICLVGLEGKALSVPSTIGNMLKTIL
ncbi:LysR family transcriptional regulator [Gordonibacter sp.]|uniref:LysR family transcriptional regulator n=1 Tax=Gordonibacter sp. TaxID=1968902 RepID=UPI002FCA76EF